MCSTELLDALDPLSAEAAERWVAAALAEAAALRAHDDVVYPATDDPAEMRTARRLHAAWGRWADEAEQLLDRLRPARAAGERIAGIDELSYAAARARAMLMLTPEVALERMEQVRRGEVFTIEEVRRELRLASRR